MDTIFALASGGGRAGVAVVRASGPAAGRALELLINRPLPPPREARLMALYDRSGQMFDRALVLWFPGPASFTGEDVAEFHVHGGRAVLSALADALDGLGLRPAEAGEFSRRAFAHGKLDLTAAEGLADLVDAETEAQRRQALRQMDGALTSLYEGWRADLLRLTARIEAYLDFPDEDLPQDLDALVRAAVADLGRAARVHLADQGRGERLRDGIQLVILGPPNVGKSSLLNMLAGRDAAIVAATAGTTRDVVEAVLDLGGLPVIVADTAGLRASTDEVELEGMRRARARAGQADLKLLMVPAIDWPALPADLAGMADGDTVIVVNRVDERPLSAPLVWEGHPAYPLSLRTGEGVEALMAELTQVIRARYAPGAAPALTRARHRRAVEDMAAGLDRALRAPTVELMAEDLRMAARALGRLTGRIDVEDILDIVFRDFCIGK